MPEFRRELGGHGRAVKPSRALRDTGPTGVICAYIIKYARNLAFKHGRASGAAS